MSSAQAPSFPGAMPPPAGIIADPSGSQNLRAPLWMTSMSIILGVPSLAVIFRFYVRGYLMKKFGVTDILLIIGWCLFIAQCGVAYPTLFEGQVGKHAWDVFPHQFARFLQLINTQQIIYMMAILFIKLSIIWQFLEIFVSRKYNHRWWTLIVLATFNVMFFTASCLAVIMVCIPREAFWNPQVNGLCIDNTKAQISTGVINVVDDFTILILPIYWVFKLQLHRGKQIALALLFALGIFACVTSVMRLTASSLQDPDLTWSLFPVSLWACGEAGTSLTIACLPALAALPRLIRNKREKSNSYANRYGTEAPLRLPSVSGLYNPMDSSTSFPKSGSGGHAFGSDARRGSREYNEEGILKTVSLQQTNLV